MSAQRTTMLVDGENIDATLGMSILGRRPQPEERPRWNNLLAHVERHWGNPVLGLFFLAVEGDLPASFVQALRNLGYRPVPARGEGKVVDIAIQRTTEALAQMEDDVALVSHDRDFVPGIETLLETPGRRVAVIGFEEFMSADLRRIPGIEFLDLERDAGAFTSPSPRLRVLDIDEFDPFDFL